MQPTFGVSFGLPPGTPNTVSNLHPYNPQLFPFGRAIQGGGINLGIATVNPLLSIQISKNEDGEKVISPLVHFHVTPSQHKINAINQLFDDKKNYLLHKHQHYHMTHPIHPYPPPQYFPHYAHAHAHQLPHPEPPYYTPHYDVNPHHPPHYESVPDHPPHYERPVYSPHYAHYEPDHYRQHDNYDNGIHEPLRGHYDSDEENGEHYDDEAYPHSQYRSLHNHDKSANVTNDVDQGSYANRYDYSRSLNLPSKSPGANQGYQTIRFPDNRRKREVDVDNISVTVLEVIHQYSLNTSFLLGTFASIFFKGSIF